jgi:hypothetical protein
MTTICPISLLFMAVVSSFTLIECSDLLWMTPEGDRHDLASSRAAGPGSSPNYVVHRMTLASVHDAHKTRARQIYSSRYVLHASVLLIPAKCIRVYSTSAGPPYWTTAARRKEAHRPSHHGACSLLRVVSSRYVARNHTRLTPRLEFRHKRDSTRHTSERIVLHKGVGFAHYATGTAHFAEGIMDGSDSFHDSASNV